VTRVNQKSVFSELKSRLLDRVHKNIPLFLVLKPFAQNFLKLPTEKIFVFLEFVGLAKQN